MASGGSYSAALSVTDVTDTDAGAQPLRNAALASGPLDGVFVLDATHVMAGPFCTYQLALLGAEVVKIESLEANDPIRTHGPDGDLNRRGMGTSFLAQNAGKRSLGLNLKHPEGQSIFRRLAQRADILVENYRPGVLDRLGLGANALRATNPRLIYCAISGYGRGGPLSNRPAYDHIIQAVSGMMHVTGTPESGPMRVGFPVTDYVAGLVAAFAVAISLFKRERTGQGETIDVAMLDAALMIMGPLLTQVSIAGRNPVLAGNLPFGGSPFSGVFATADGALAVVGSTGQQCVGICRVLGLTELAADPRIANWRDHGELAAEVGPLLDTAYRSSTAEAWENALSAADVPAGKLRGLQDIMFHPHVMGRHILHTIERVPGIDRDIAVPNVGFKLGRAGSKMRPPPLPFANTREILRELGYHDSEIGALELVGAVANSH
jgi:CoA:oxalate CoA-transferase